MRNEQDGKFISARDVETGLRKDVISARSIDSGLRKIKKDEDDTTN